jgi:tetraacyldisaccharide 4'-kinase
MRAPVERWLTGVWSDPADRRPLARALLALPSVVYAMGEAVVRTGFDRRWRTVRLPMLPTISVGNLSVGGTGKTPVAAWLAEAYLARGVPPALVLRGYGGDESLVHARLVPGAIIETGADRRAGIAAAAARGARVAILDDGFQHRRVARALDLVLLSAEQVAGELTDDGVWHPRLLPAGPYREPPVALRRADALILTIKTADAEAVRRVREALSRVVPGCPLVTAHLEPSGLVWAAGSRDVPALAGTPVLAVAGIGAPALFGAQLAALGARVTLRPYADHHPYDARDVAALVAEGRRFGGVVCTLKDAVKLVPRWPSDGPSLSYLSQRCTITEGGAGLATMLAAVLPGPPGTVAPPTSDPGDTTA